MGTQLQPAAGVVGAYGKLPSRGDFVRRRLPSSFLEPWDDWLQRAVTRSRENLAEQWLPLYLNGPIWRFALAAPLIGQTVAAGVVMPSVDSVQRHFPLTLAALFPADVNPFAIALEESWFSDLEELAPACLDLGFAPEELDARLDALAPPPLPGSADPGARGGWPIVPDRDAYATLLYPAVLDRYVRETTGVYSLWWTAGSDAVEPSFRIVGGLPGPETFSGFFADDVAPVPDADPAPDDEDRLDAAVSEET